METYQGKIEINQGNMETYQGKIEINQGNQPSKI